MDVLILYCDSGAPSRQLRFLEAGIYHQVLADNQFQVTSLLVRSDASAGQITEQLRRDPARLVALLFDEFNAFRSRQMAEALRQEFPDLPLCAFGIYPVLAPDRCFESRAVDYMIIGEGEIALYELATTLLRGGDVRAIKNLWYRANGRTERNPLRPLQENLDLLPYPDRSLFTQDPTVVPFSEQTLYVAASRGCPYECLFCYSPVLRRAYSAKGSYYRIRSAQNLVGEILSELRRQPYGRIVFADEMFPADRMWLRDFARRMAGAKPPPGEVVIAAEKCDADTLDQLQTAGIRRLVLGLETGSDSFRRRIAARNLGNDHIQTVAALARERSMAIITSNMVALPLESAPLAEETYAFNKSLAPDEVRCTVYQPIEGSQLEAVIRERKLPVVSGGEEAPDFSRATLQLPDFSSEALHQYLYKMHFLDLSQKLQAMPKPSNAAYCFLSALPKARFRLVRSSSVNVGVTERAGRQIGYLALEAGSECRYPVTLPPRAALRFALSAAATAIHAIRTTGGFLVADVIWEPEGAEAQVLFSRMIASGETTIARQWHDSLVFGPEEGGSGQILFRVLATPAAAAGAFLFWGDPILTTGVALSGDTGYHAELEAKLDAASVEAAALRRDLEQLRESEQQARQERDGKARRVGELQIRILEMEKQLEEQAHLLQELQPADGLGGKLKGLFRK